MVIATASAVKTVPSITLSTKSTSRTATKKITTTISRTKTLSNRSTTKSFSNVVNTPAYTTSVYTIPVHTTPVYATPVYTTTTYVQTTTVQSQATNVDRSIYSSCDPQDWGCKSRMSEKCTAEVVECWGKSYTPELGLECNTIQNICNSIWN